MTERERLVARRRRTLRIRNRVATVAVSTFLASFGAISVQVANGSDPGLRSASATIRTSRTPKSTKAVSSTTTAAQTAQQARPSAVTTQQS
jgi:hypothetical protein